MAFAGGEGEQENKPISISVVTAYPEGDESYVTVMAFKDKVEELGQSQIEVKVFHSRSMGGEKDTGQAVKLGSAQVVTCGLLPVSMFTQDYAFFDDLYVFKDFDHFEATWNTKPGQGIRDILIDNNLRAMGIYERGARQLAANVPINKPEDAAGLKLRVPIADLGMYAGLLVGFFIIGIPRWDCHHFSKNGFRPGQFSAMAIPLFVLAGNLMNIGGITTRMFNFASSLVGHMRLGLAQANIVASMIFSECPALRPWTRRQSDRLK